MIIITTKKCPKEVEAKLLEYQRKGWLELQSDPKPKSKSQEVTITTPEICPTPPKEPMEVQWVNRLKAIAKEIEKKLVGKNITTNAKGHLGSYVLRFDSQGFCDMMDRLLDVFPKDITTYLHGTRKPVGVTLVFPFLGEIINARIFNAKELQKSDLTSVFESFGYKGTTAIAKLSCHTVFDRNACAKLLKEKAIMIGKNCINAE